MRMEFGGTGNKKGLLQVYTPGEMPEEVEENINSFLFPQNTFSDDFSRRTEIQINDQYKNRSTTFVFIKNANILATCRIISKSTPEERLPIEASKVINVLDNRFEPFLKIGLPFSIDSIPDSLPACELGGLRAIDTTTDTQISIRDRYEALSTVLLSSEKEAIRQGFKIGFLTCLGTNNLQKMYKTRFHFEEIAEVSYGDSVRWKALYRKR